MQIIPRRLLRENKTTKPTLDKLQNKKSDRMQGGGGLESKSRQAVMQ